MQITANLPMFESGCVPYGDSTILWLVVETNMANKKGQRLFHYVLKVWKGGKSERCITHGLRADYVSTVSYARRRAEKLAEKR